MTDIMAYQDFMWNPKNEYNCKACPENKGDTWSKHPCGQQNCWVTCHTKHSEDDDD